MTGEDWQRVKAILGEANELPPGRRTAYIRQACEGDPQLLAEILALLEADSPETILQLQNPLGRLRQMMDPHPDQDTQGFQASPGAFPADAQRESDLAGALIKDRYRIEKALGRGGFAVTYLATDTQLDGRSVVVKVLLDHHADDPWVLKKFHQEMRVLARLDHPGVVGALDSGLLPDSRPFLVMQFVKGALL